jgi:hypothetical protein
MSQLQETRRKTQEENHMTQSTAAAECERRRPRRGATAGLRTPAAVHNATMQTRPATVDISGQSNPDAGNRNSPSEPERPSLPALSHAAMIEAFRKQRRLEHTATEPERVLESIVSATGPGCLVRDVLRAPDQEDETNSTDRSAPVPQ